MTSNQSKDTVPGARAGVIKLGLDIHASLIVVVRQVDGQASQQSTAVTRPDRLGTYSTVG